MCSLRKLALLALLLGGGLSVEGAQCHLLLLGAGTCGAAGTPQIVSTLAWASDLDEASGDAIDAVGALDLAETGGTIAADAGSGGCGPARNFVATDTEYFAHLDNAVFDIGDINAAWEVWVNATSLPASVMDIVSKYEPTGNQRSYRIIYDNATTSFTLRVSQDGTGTFLPVEFTGHNPATATCYQIFTYIDTTNNVIGISVNDGTRVTQVITGGIFESTGPFHIGALGSATPSSYWDGLIAKVRLWKNFIPTTTQQTCLYNSGNGKAFADIADCA